MTSDQITAADVHQHVHELRATAAQAPAKIELGRQQRAAIEADVRTAAGTDDIGPLVQFQGLQIVKSRRDDHVKLLATGEDGEDLEIDVLEPVAPSGPDAPAVEAEPSGV